VSESRLRLVRWLLARRRAVGALVSAGVETPAGGMAVGKTLRSRATYLALMSAGIVTAASGMAVGKTPCSRSTREHRDRDSGWRDGCWQDAAQ